MITVTIRWQKEISPLAEIESQKKKFKTVNDCVQWCRQNFIHIFAINNYRTLNMPVSQCEIMDAINGFEN